jgi:hypothetical protein
MVVEMRISGFVVIRAGTEIVMRVMHRQASGSRKNGPRIFTFIHCLTPAGVHGTLGAMISVRLYKRRKRICQTTVLWGSACIIAMLGATSAWMGLKNSATSGRAVPAMDLSEPDIPQATPPTPQVNGDGVLDTPVVVVKLVPALASEVGASVKSGDAREALGQFCRWITSGEALRSEVFWMFWSVMGLGVVAVMCCSLVEHFLQWRRRLEVRSAGAGGPDGTLPTDETEQDSSSG